MTNTKSYYEKNKEKLREQAREYYHNNKESIRGYWKEKYKEESWRRVQQLRVIKSRAKKNGIPFDITVNDLEWPTHCPLLGIELTYEGHKDSSPSIDKINPSLGYIKGNCKVISNKANNIKTDATYEELRTFMSNLDSYFER